MKQGIVQTSSYPRKIVVCSDIWWRTKIVSRKATAVAKTSTSQ